MTTELKVKKIFLTDDSLGLLHSLSSSGVTSILVEQSSRPDFFLSQIDFLILSAFLRLHEIELSHYCWPIKTTISIDDKCKIALGDSSFVNLQELYRKLGLDSKYFNSIDSDEFSEAFSMLVKEIVDFLSRGESLQDQIYAILKKTL